MQIKSRQLNLETALAAWCHLRGKLTPTATDGCYVDMGVGGEHRFGFHMHTAIDRPTQPARLQE